MRMTAMTIDFGADSPLPSTPLGSEANAAERGMGLAANRTMAEDRCCAASIPLFEKYFSGG